MKAPHPPKNHSWNPRLSCYRVHYEKMMGNGICLINKPATVIIILKMTLLRRKISAPPKFLTFSAHKIYNLMANSPDRLNLAPIRCHH